MRLLHLSDLHVRGDGSAHDLRVQALLAAAQLVAGPTGALLITGDLTDNSHPDAWSFLLASLPADRNRFYLVAGNHDRGGHGFAGVDAASSALADQHTTHGARLAVGPRFFSPRRPSVLLCDSTIRTPEPLTETARGCSGLGFARLLYACGQQQHASPADVVAVHHDPTRTYALDPLAWSRGAEFLGAVCAGARFVCCGHAGRDVTLSPLPGGGTLCNADGCVDAGQGVLLDFSATPPRAEIVPLL